jgi:hypothetical protein
MEDQTVVKKGVVTKESAPQGTQIVVQELRIIAPDRTPKDIADFITALRNAEAVYVPQRARLYDLYTNVLLDGKLSGMIAKRIADVLNKNLYFKDKAGKKDDQITDLIETMVFRNMLKKIMETPGWGVSGFEFEPGPKFHWKEIPRKHIKPEKKMIAFDQYGEDGVSYEGVSNLWILGETRDLGYLARCAPYALWKRGNFADWAQYIEIFGQPVRIAKYDGYDMKTKMELQEVLENAGSSLAMLLPKQAEFEIMDGKQSNGDGQLQERFKQACDEELAVIVFAVTETTNSSRSSGYAQAKEHGKQKLDITKDDMKYILNTLNTSEFFTILRSYGYNPDGGKFCYEKEIDVEALKARAEVDQIVSTKVPFSDDYWYDTYGVTKPDNYDELKAKMDAEKTASEKDVMEEDNTPGLKKHISGKPKPALKNKDNPIMAKNLAAKRSFITFLRTALADFFDPAP